MLRTEKFLLISVEMSVLIGGLCFLLCVTIVLCRPEVNIESRIVGGAPAAVGEFPYQVSLRRNGQHFCGGSIISKRSILTAAHCIYGNNNPMTAVVGTNKLNSGGTSYTVATAVYHESYDPNNIYNDVAVLTVDSPITYGIYVDLLGLLTLRAGPAVRKIVLSTANPAAGTTVVLSGWGLTSYPGNIPNDLQKIELTALDLQTCANNLAGVNTITTGNVCTTSSVGFGACQGDSGGPLVLISTQTQVGIVSWGVPCAKGYPDVFASVASYLGWINANAILD